MARVPKKLRDAYPRSSTLRIAAARIAKSAPDDDEALRKGRQRLIRLQGLVLLVGLAAFAGMPIVPWRELQLFLTFVVASAAVLLLAGLIGWALMVIDRRVRSRMRDRMAALLESEKELSSMPPGTEPVLGLTAAAKEVQSFVQSLNSAEALGARERHYSQLQQRLALLSEKRLEAEACLERISTAAHELEPVTAAAKELEDLAGRLDPREATGKWRRDVQSLQRKAADLENKGARAEECFERMLAPV